MPVEKFAQVEIEAPVAKRAAKRYKGDTVMLVVGAEEGRILLHQTGTSSFTITGENTVDDLREADINVEDWVKRGLIAPLGQLATRAEPVDDDSKLFEPVAAVSDDPDADEDEDRDEDEDDEEEMQFDGLALNDDVGAEEADMPTHTPAVTLPLSETGEVAAPTSTLKVKAKDKRRGRNARQSAHNG